MLIVPLVILLGLALVIYCSKCQFGHRQSLSLPDIEKADMNNSRPNSPIPEIRLTFPIEDRSDVMPREVTVEIGEAGCAFVRPTSHPKELAQFI